MDWVEQSKVTQLPLIDVEITAPAEELSGGEEARLAQVHQRLLRDLVAAQHRLLSIRSARSLINYLLVDLPRDLGSPAAELRLHDPERVVAGLLGNSPFPGASLALLGDSYSLYRLYPSGASPELLDLEDPRMFRILPDAANASGAILLPLIEGNYLVGSYHLALQPHMPRYTDEDKELLAMLGQLVSQVLASVVEHEKAARLALLDPVTELGNLRALRRDLLREVDWARRNERPVSLLFIGLDDFEGLRHSTGEVSAHTIERRVTERMARGVRTTDYLCHVASGLFAVLLPACNEAQAHSVAERLCRDARELAVDDERGAVFQIDLSVGLVCWEPLQLPMESSERLAQEMESEAESAMLRAQQIPDHTVSVARLGLRML